MLNNHPEEHEPTFSPVVAQETESRRKCAPPMIELTTELSELELFCPFCGDKVYDWAAKTNVSPCSHLFVTDYNLTGHDDHNFELGDVIFVVCDSGPRPETLLLAFRDQESHDSVN